MSENQKYLNEKPIIKMNNMKVIKLKSRKNEVSTPLRHKS